MTPRPDIPPTIAAKWQGVVDLIAELAKVPAALIMQTLAPRHVVFVSSNVADNPYLPGRSYVLNDRLYCQGVIASKAELVVVDARKERRWADNEDMEHAMSFYIGLPIKWPDDQIFGTICVLDRRRNRRALLFREGLQEFSKVIEADLALLTEVQRREAAEADLRRTLSDREDVIMERTRALQEANTALRVLLDNIETKQKDAGIRTAHQIRSLILPLVSRLRTLSVATPAQSALLDAVSRNLEDICSAQASRKSGLMAKLTATEAEVAELVLMGRATKEIARVLGRGTSTIDFHRGNIRRKLGLCDRGMSLAGHLNSLSR